MKICLTITRSQFSVQLSSSDMSAPIHNSIFHGLTAPKWARASFSKLHDHTQTHHPRKDSSGQVTIPTQGPLPDNTLHSEETGINTLGGIRTRNLASEHPQTYPLHRAATGIVRSISLTGPIQSKLNCAF